MLYLELWQTTWSIIRSIHLKELGNNILHTRFQHFAKIQALCAWTVIVESANNTYTLARLFIVWYILQI